LTITLNNTHVVLAGDWNVDFYKSEVHKPLLNDLIDKHDLVLADTLHGYEVDYTYNFDLQHFSTLDHFIISPTLASLPNVSVTVSHDVDNLSDQDPVCLQMYLDIQSLTMPPPKRVRSHAWYKCNSSNLSEYAEKLRSLLSDIDVPVGALVCDNLMCNDLSHCESLKEYSHSSSDGGASTSGVRSVVFSTYKIW